MNVMLVLATTALQLAAKFGANAALDFSVVDEAGKPVEAARIVQSQWCTQANPPIDLTTDARGHATYRGLVFKSVSFGVISPAIYGVPRRRMEFSALTTDGRTWATNTVPPVVVRRKLAPHKMGAQSILLMDLPNGTTTNDFFIVSFGDYRGYDGNGRTLVKCVVEIRPRQPEDGFAVVDLFDDVLGAPLVAPKDGYKSAPVYYIDENDDGRDNSNLPCRAFSFDPHCLTTSLNGTALVFRHQTEKGFVYGCAKVTSAPREGGLCRLPNADPFSSVSYPSGLRYGWGGKPRCLDVWFNHEPGNLSLEPETVEKEVVVSE